MRVLAARFPDRDRASAVLGRLERTLQLRPPEVAIAPLGVVGGGDGEDTLLAGRIPEESADAVARLVREAGGEIVANVDERWTRPRQAGPPH
jgi:hypothetical protein